MTRTNAILALVLVALAGAVRVGHADRYEVSLHLQPGGGVAWIGEAGTSSRERVWAGGLGGRATYGLRDWLAVEVELHGATFGPARFADVPVSIDGTAMRADLERTTRRARATGAATLRLGVAWIPTVSFGLGGQMRWAGAAHVVGAGTVPDGREGGLSVVPVALGRVGLDHRLSRRFVIGASIGGSYAIASEPIAELDAQACVAWYWYPSP